MNKADIETMSIDDLYNNFKIVEQEVKKSVGASSGTQNMAFMTTLSTSSTNDVNTTNPTYKFSTDSSNTNTASSSVGTANICDKAMYAFMVENPNGSNLLHQDLEQIHEDDLEAMDLKWQLSLLSLRAKRYYQRTGKKIFINANDTARYQDNSRNQESSKRTVNVEDTSSKAMLAIHGVGFDWSDMEEEQIQTNMALMAFSDSKGTVLKSTFDYDKESNSSKGNTDDSLEKEQVSDNENNSVESSPNVVKETVFHVAKKGKPQLNDKGFVDSGCSRHMAGNIAYLLEFKEFDEGYVTFGGGAYGGRITDKGTLKTNNLDFDDVYFLNEVTLVESMLWHRRLGHINLKNINKLVKENIVKGLPLKHFENDQTCVACLKGKQHRASCKSKVMNFITKPLFMLHMDLFGPTFVSSLMHKKYCLVVINDYRRFTWVLFLPTKDETSEILKNFNKEIQNLVDKKVKIIRCDNGIKFKNKLMDDFCREKGIRREYSVVRTPQQNGVAERTNKTLIEAARTILAGSKLPTTFWDEAVSTACYVHNRVLIVKPHNKTPNELFRGIKPTLSFMKPFGCHVTILNTLDNLGKFDGKSDEGFFVGYSLYSKAFRVQPLMNLQEHKEIKIQDDGNDEPKSATDDPKQVEDGSHNEDDSSPNKDNTTEQQVNIASSGVNIGSIRLNIVYSLVNTTTPEDMLGANQSFEATHVEFFNDKNEPEVQLENIPNSYALPTTPHTRIHKDHPIENVIGDMQSSVQTRRMAKPTFEQGFLSVVYEGKTHQDLHTCLFACFLSHEEPKRISKALNDPAWVEEIQEELLQFKLQKIEEEVYVCQPLRFEDPNYPNKVYKVVKALYGLHQAPRAWYETLANYLLANGFQRGKIDQTLFIKKQKEDILLVQNYVDDIIFGSTKNELCIDFEKLMKDKFQMSSMEELTFFLRLQVQYRKDGIFIYQDKYVDEILRKFKYTDVKSASTLVHLEKPLVKDGDATEVDEHIYRSMIRSLMYLTASRPDIMFAVCACARFQVTPRTSHLLVVKRIFRYLKGNPTLGFWYSMDSPFELVILIVTMLEKLKIRSQQLEVVSFWETGKTQKGRDIKVPQSGGPPIKVGDEAVHKKMGDRIERATATDFSLEAEHDNVGSTMRIPLMYQGEYSQWRERFMNYLEEQMDGEAMIYSIQNEKTTRKIDRLARSLLIQGLPNDIYSLIDSNKTAKDLWDALERQMCGSEYGEQDMKVAISYEMEIVWHTDEANQEPNGINIDALYNILKQNQGLVAEKTKVSKQKEKFEVQTESEGSNDDDISDLKKITTLLAKAFNRKKYYAKPTNNNLRTSLASSLAKKKPEYVKSVEKKEDKKVKEKKRDMSKVKCYNCKKEGHFAKDCKKANVKDYNYYKIKMLLAKKDSDEQVLL
uniref:Putative ribonuclease H-like domain-containing protein n=1 Tax=Tanacetum cinerariifolium TaxID=118510 RepID=A0A6L2MUA0_TANCI|nr:putative ribonuclease H-like domain-containing protein [Tanacetum cinerariifolium]